MNESSSSGQWSLIAAVVSNENKIPIVFGNFHPGCLGHCLLRADLLLLVQKRLIEGIPVGSERGHVVGKMCHGH